MYLPFRCCKRQRAGPHLSGLPLRVHHRLAGAAPRQDRPGPHHRGVSGDRRHRRHHPGIPLPRQRRRQRRRVRLELAVQLARGARAREEEAQEPRGAGVEPHHGRGALQHRQGQFFNRFIYRQ